MAKKLYDEKITKATDWGGDNSTGGLPVSGTRVQEFIKEELEKKMGVIHYDSDHNRYLVFADETNRDFYLSDPERYAGLLQATFEAPFNYEVSVKVDTPTYNAVFAGSKGNYIDFSFVVRNKQGADTGDGVTAIYTFERNGVTRTLRQDYNAGEGVHLSVDEYLGEGVNRISVSLTGKQTLARTSFSVTYRVVSLTLKDSMNPAAVYDLSTGQKTVEIPYTVSGYGAKVMEWYLDGQLLPHDKTEDEIADVSSTRVKYITLSNLSQGVHSLQMRVYTVIEGEKFYSPTLYRDLLVYTGADTEDMVGISTVIPAGEEIVTDGVILSGATQYVPYELAVAVCSPTNKQSISLEMSVNGESVTTASVTPGIVTRLSYTPTAEGTFPFALKAEGKLKYTGEITIAKTTMQIAEITQGLSLDFNAKGRNNHGADRDVWTYGGFQGRFSDFKWNEQSGWVGDCLRISSGAVFEIDCKPFDVNPTLRGKTVEIEFAVRNVEDDDAVLLDMTTDGVGLRMTASKATLISAGGKEISISYAPHEMVRLAFVIQPRENATRKRMSFIYEGGKCSGAVDWIATDSYISTSAIRFTGRAEAEIDLKAVRIYDVALTDDQILNNFILSRNTVEEMREVYDRNDFYVEGTTELNWRKMGSRLPVLRLTGNIPVLLFSSLFLGHFIYV